MLDEVLVFVVFVALVVLFKGVLEEVVLLLEVAFDLSVVALPVFYV